MLNVIIPIYHSKKTLPDTLDSLVCQTHKRFFVTLVNDCDGEDYQDIIDEYNRRGLKIYLINHSKNTGPGQARQTGLEATPDMFDYVMFLDSDDMLMPRAIEILTKESNKNNLDICSGSFIHEEIGSPGQVMTVQKDSCTWVLGKIYRVKYLKEKKIFFHPTLRLNEDSYFNLVAFASTKKKAVIDEVCGIWRENKESLTRKESSEEFFKKGSGSYILAQIAAQKKIVEINGDITDSTITESLLNIYSTMMVREYLKLPQDEFINELLSLKQCQFIQDYLAEGRNWISLVNKVKAGIVLENRVIVFYKQRLVDWIVQYIQDKNNKVFMED